MSRSKHVIVITRNGETQVISGWRAWLYGLGGLLLAWTILGLVVFAFVGIAATIGIALLLLIPALLIVAAIASLMDGSVR